PIQRVVPGPASERYALRHGPGVDLVVPRATIGGEVGDRESVHGAEDDVVITRPAPDQHPADRQLGEPGLGDAGDVDREHDLAPVRLGPLLDVVVAGGAVHLIGGIPGAPAGLGALVPVAAHLGALRAAADDGVVAAMALNGCPPREA